MKVFISSLIAGFEEFRLAAVSAVSSLGHTPITAETFGAGTASPRLACLGGVREADLVVLILGANYGVVQPVSGISATHEEYREAKNRRPVLAFVQEGVERDARQVAFVQEIQDWQSGLFRQGFRTPDALRDAITRDIHRYELANAAAPVDTAEMLTRATALIPGEQRNMIRVGGPLLHLAVVGGPAQPILRPVEIERSEFGRELLQAATFGEHAIFDHARGSSADVRDGVLLLGQDSGAAVVLDERGSVRLSIPVSRGGGHMPAIIDENVSAKLDQALGYATWLLEKIDAVHRLSRIVVVAALADAGMGAWRTQREQDASPNSMTYSHGFNNGERPPVHFQPPDRPRAAIGFDRDRIVEDLKTLLRRQWQ